MQRIRVLIVDDVKNTREDIKRFLYFEEDMEVVGEAATGEEAVELAQQIKPDVVLMDINLPGMDGIAASEIISVQVPEASIIIISIQGEQEYLKKAMAAGARDYLVKPFTSTELAETIRRANAFSRKRSLRLVGQEEKAAGSNTGPAGKIITLFSTKGGVGKTTLACNLAIALAGETNKNVVLVDLDLQGGDVSVILNMAGVHTISELVQEDLDHDVAVTDTFLAAHFSGIKVLFAPNSPEQAELVTPDHVAGIIGHLKSVFDFVIVDTAPSYSEINLNVLELADQILLLVAQDLPTLKHVRSTVEVLNALHYSDKIALLLNQLRPDGISVKELEKSLGLPMTAVIPTDDRTVLQSVNKGQPFVLGHKNSRVAESVLELARKLSVMENKVVEKTPARAASINPIKKIFSFSR
ncbi:response regulator [Desulfallas sp. Bu1-1]|uniref:AAA family ATPase n=1 Tax=Desulfallas sp. Bu1-1 TaxID=2787620 RepID=UPI00189EC792|nr:response regulator [Desulfallas sp. Bu1-1]MBF7082490.1 response regulator [Desulfallas sp. Bu1-1]